MKNYANPIKLLRVKLNENYKGADLRKIEDATVDVINNDEEYKNLVTRDGHYSYTYLESAKIEDVNQMFGFYMDFDTGYSIEDFMQTSLYKRFNCIINTSKSHQQSTKIKQGDRNNGWVDEVINILPRDRFHVFFPFSDAVLLHDSGKEEKLNSKYKIYINQTLNEFLTLIYNSDEFKLTDIQLDDVRKEKILSLTKDKKYKNLTSEQQQKEIDKIRQQNFMSGDIAVSDIARGIFPCRPQNTFKIDEEKFKIISSLDKEYISLEYIIKEVEKSKIKDEVIELKSLNDKSNIERIKYDEFDFLGDTDINVNNAIELLSKSPISYDEYVRIAFAIKNTKGANGVELFKKFGNNPHFPTDNENGCIDFYNRILNRPDRDKKDQISTGSIIRIAKNYGFTPIYTEAEFNSADKLALILNINKSSLKSQNKNEIKMVFCDGKEVYYQIFNTINFSSKIVIRRVETGSDIAQQLQNLYPPYTPEKFKIVKSFGINKTENGKRLFKGESVNIDDIINEVKETKILNNPFDTQDEIRRNQTITINSKLPTPDMTQTIEFHNEQSVIFEDIIKSIYCNGDLTLKTLLRYTVQNAFEQRDKNGQARPILLLSSMDRAKGKNILADLFKLLFGEENIAKGETKTDFNSFFEKALVIFDEKEESRSALGVMLKEITGDNNQNLNAKFGKKNDNAVVFCNIIVTSNTRPISIAEMPQNDKNNPYLFANLTSNKATVLEDITKKYKITTSISAYLYECMKSWLWTKGIAILNEILELRKTALYRYGFPIPVTKALQELHEDSTTQSINSAMTLLSTIYDMSDDTIERNTYSAHIYQIKEMLSKNVISIPLLSDFYTLNKFNMKKENLKIYFVKANFMSNDENPFAKKICGKNIKCNTFNTKAFLDRHSAIIHDDIPPMLPNGTDDNHNKKIDILTGDYIEVVSPNKREINSLSAKLENKIINLYQKGLTANDILDTFDDLSLDVIQNVISKLNKSTQTSEVKQVEVKHEVTQNVEPKSNLTAEIQPSKFTQKDGKTYYNGKSILADDIEEYFPEFENDYIEYTKNNTDVVAIRNCNVNVITSDTMKFEGVDDTPIIKSENETEKFDGVGVVIKDENGVIKDTMYIYSEKMYEYYELKNEKGEMNCKFYFIDSDKFYQMF
jgi:hypothetical protein